MSNTDTDSFIREVTEEVRQDRLIGYWKKYGPYVIGAIAAIVLAAAALAWQENAAREAARDRGEVLIKAAEAVGGGLTPQSVEGLTEGLDGAARMVGDLQIARARARAGDREGAVAALLAVADDGTQPQRYTDLARLEAARLQLLTGQLDAAMPALEELARPEGLYRPLALELRAITRLNAGDLEGARGDMLSILTDLSTSPETRSRVQALQSTLPPEDPRAALPSAPATPAVPQDGALDGAEDQAPAEAPE